jgi:hypothetical protein
MSGDIFDDFFIICSIVAVVASAIVNLAYYFTHSNGKKHIRLIAGLSMLYVTSILLQRLLHYRIISMSEIWPFLPIFFSFPMLDAIVDWNKNKLPPNKRMDDLAEWVEVSTQKREEKKDRRASVDKAVEKTEVESHTIPLENDSGVKDEVE